MHPWSAKQSAPDRRARVQVGGVGLHRRQVVAHGDGDVRRERKRRLAGERHRRAGVLRVPVGVLDAVDLGAVEELDRERAVGGDVGVHGERAVDLLLEREQGRGERGLVGVVEVVEAVAGGVGELDGGVLGGRAGEEQEHAAMVPRIGRASLANFTLRRVPHARTG